MKLTRRVEIDDDFPFTVVISVDPTGPRRFNDLARTSRMRVTSLPLSRRANVFKIRPFDIMTIGTMGSMVHTGCTAVNPEKGTGEEGLAAVASGTGRSVDRCG